MKSSKFINEEQRSLRAAVYMNKKKQLDAKSKKMAKLFEHYMNMLDREFEHYIDGINRFPNAKAELFRERNIQWKSTVNEANKLTPGLELSPFAFEQMVKHFDLVVEIAIQDERLPVKVLASLNNNELELLKANEDSRNTLADKIINEFKEDKE